MCAEQLNAITAHANGNLMRHEDPTLCQFLVREPCRTGGGGDGLVARRAHGLAARVQVRPTGWHVVVSLDGLPPISIPKGGVLDMRVEDDAGQWLRTIELEPRGAS